MPASHASPGVVPMQGASPLHTDLSLSYRVLNPEQIGHATHLLLLLHGVGANETSLAEVGRQLAGPALVLSVRAPLTLGPNAYGFYRVSFATGRPVYDAAEEQSSRQLLIRFIDEARQQYGFAASQTYLLGFSQGAIMAYTIGTTHPGSVGGVLACSGRLLDEVRPLLAPAEELRHIRFFISHGAQDGTLPAAYAQQAVAFLQQHQLPVEYHAFAGGHEIPASSVAAARHWLYGGK